LLLFFGASLSSKQTVYTLFLTLTIERSTDNKSINDNEVKIKILN